MFHFLPFRPPKGPFTIAFPTNPSGGDIRRLVALNAERAEEERRGSSAGVEAASEPSGLAMGRKWPGCKAELRTVSDGRYVEERERSSLLAPNSKTPPGPPNPRARWPCRRGGEAFPTHPASGAANRV